MRRSTTSAVTERPLLGLLLLVELIVAVALIGGPPRRRARRARSRGNARRRPHRRRAPSTLCRRPHRHVDDAGRSADATAADPDRAANWTAPPTPSPRSGVTTGPATSSSWPPHRRGVPCAGRRRTPTSPRRPPPSGSCSRPGAAAMSDAALRIVLRHELFHYAARADDRARRAAVADRGRRRLRRRGPPTPRPGPARPPSLAQLPTDADLDTVGATRSLAYDRAWWFSRFVADRYGTADAAQPLRARRAGPATPTSRRPSATRSAPTRSVLAAWRDWLTRLACPR